MSDKQPPQANLTVTDCDAAVETAPRTAVSEEGGSGGSTRARAREAAPTIAHWWKIAIGDAPSLWSEAPATPAEMVRYAKDGEWCAHDSTVWRFLGRAYSALVAIPSCVVLYLLAWCVQRPGRLAGLAILLVVLYQLA